jgi:hypothetical protein
VRNASITTISSMAVQLIAMDLYFYGITDKLERPYVEHTRIDFPFVTDWHSSLC